MAGIPRCREADADSVQWSSTQAQLQQALQRDTFGLSVPLRISMEKKIVQEVSLSLITNQGMVLMRFSRCTTR